MGTKKKKPRKTINRLRSSVTLRSSSKLNARAQGRLDDALFLYESGDYQEALQTLEPLLRRYGMNPDVLELRSIIANQLNDALTGMECAGNLVKLKPRDLVWRYNLAVSYMRMGFPFLAKSELDTIEDGRLPRELDGKMFAEFRTIVLSATSHISTRMSKSFPCFPNLGFRHDLIRLHLAESKFEDAIEQVEKLTSEVPNFIPAWNNKSIAHYRLGDIEAALDSANRVIEIDPNNTFAYASHLRCSYLLGHTLKRPQHLFTKPITENFNKQLECLLYLDDYKTITQLFEAMTEKEEDFPDEVATIHNIAAFAYAILEKHSRAKECWQTSLKVTGNNRCALENLTASKAKKGQGTGPWIFSLHEILPNSVFHELKNDVTGLGFNNIAQRQKFFHRLFCLMARFGDEQSIELALIVFNNRDSAELLEALEQFATSKRCSDNLRSQVALSLGQKRGKQGRISLWQEGTKKDLLLFGIKITWDAEPENDPIIEEFKSQISQAMESGDGIYAEELSIQAIKLQPNDPTLLYNLCVCFQRQNRQDEAHELLQEIHKKFPDYLFAIVQVAKLRMADGELELAGEMLDPLWHRPTLHISEFRALADARFFLMLAKGEFDHAAKFLETIKETELLDKKQLAYFKKQLNQARKRYRMSVGATSVVANTM